MSSVLDRLRAAARARTNTVDSDGPPIIMVPGVMGSRIEKLGGGYLWDPDDLEGTLGLAAMHSVDRAELLDITKTDSKVMERWNDDKYRCSFLERQRGWAGLAWEFYKQGLIDLQSWANEWKGKVYAFGYDWRQSNIKSGKLLASRIKEIRQIHDNRRVLVVTHSMGGLVTRAACAVHGAEDDVMGVVHTLQPAYGTPLAYRLCKMGAESGTSWIFGMDRSKGWKKGLEGWVGDHVLAIIQGRSVEQYAVIASGLRGPFELLPNQDMHECTGDEGSQLPGIHNKATNSWLKLDVTKDLEPALSSGIIYDYYLEESGVVGLLNFREWESTETRYITDKGLNSGFDTIDEIAAAGTRQLSPSAEPLGTKAVSGQKVANGVRNGIKAARSYHMEKVKSYCHPNTSIVAGDGLIADVGFRISTGTLYGYNYERITAPHSDGTVSLASATALRLQENSKTKADCKGRQFLVTGAKHAAAFGESATFREITWIACDQTIRLGKLKD